jgi:hypothetical protein
LRSEHVAADVDTDDRPVGANPLEQLSDVESRPAADVEHALARFGGKRSVHEVSATQHVARGVKPLKALDHAAIELQLAHDAAMSALGSSRWIA